MHRDPSLDTLLDLEGVDYPYQDAASLIRDFWLAVNRIFEEMK